MSNINLTLTKEELETAVSGLLFSCSVNVISNTNKEYQISLLSLATKLKESLPDITLDNIQFLKEDNYEDEISQLVLDHFEKNIKIVSFDEL